jgi:putative SOS response-associated peptidase YedK
MCGRTTLKTPAAALAAAFELAPLAELAPRWNIAPGQLGLVVAAGPEPAAGPRQAAPRTWGLRPRWWPAGRPPPINARAETVASKPAFREAFLRRRAIALVDGYYEWGGGVAPDGRPARQPYHVARPDGAPFALAALWEGETYCLVTTTPTPSLRAFHDRMPALLEGDGLGAWLFERPAGPDELAALLAPCADGALVAWPVAPLVNRVANEGPALIAPWQPPAPAQGRLL